MRFYKIGWGVVAVCLLATAPMWAQNVFVSESPEVEAVSSGGSASTEVVSDESAAAQQVEVVSFSGTVEVKRSGSADYENAEEGMLLESGDTVKTGAGASAVLGFDEDDKNIVRIEENTTSVVLLKGDEKIELLQGEVFSIIQHLPAGTSFEVRTPTAVAGARGTEWATRYDGQETEVEAYDDVPFVKTIDEAGKFGAETKVTTGFATRVAKFRPPTAMSRIPEIRREKWQNQRQVIRQGIQNIRERRGRPDRAKFQAMKNNLKGAANASGVAKIDRNLEKMQGGLKKVGEQIEAAAEKKNVPGKALISDAKSGDLRQDKTDRAQIKSQKVADNIKDNVLSVKKADAAGGASSEMAQKNIKNIRALKDAVTKTQEQRSVQAKPVGAVSSQQAQRQAVKQNVKSLTPIATKSVSAAERRK